jgi:hypothetical protein
MEDHLKSLKLTVQELKNHFIMLKKHLSQAFFENQVTQADDHFKNHLA